MLVVCAMRHLHAVSRIGELYKFTVGSASSEPSHGRRIMFLQAALLYMY